MLDACDFLKLCLWHTCHTWIKYIMALKVGRAVTINVYPNMYMRFVHRKLCGAWWEANVGLKIWNDVMPRLSTSKYSKIPGML